MKKHLTLFGLSVLLLAQAASAQPRRDSRHDRDYRYSRAAPPRVSVIATLPRGAIEVLLGNARYHYYSGRYYRSYDRGYCIVRPPVGILIPALPPNCTVVIVGGRRYYHYEEVYYLPSDRGYEVVNAPQEPVAPKPATGAYEKIMIDGKTYYKKDDSFYKAVVDDKGELFYEKVGQAG